MDNNGKSNDYESVYESSDTEYDSDSSVKVRLILGKLTQTQWSQVTEWENGHLDFQFNSSVSGTKHIQNCDTPTDFFYLLYSPYLWNLIMENTNKYAKSVPIKN